MSGLQGTVALQLDRLSHESELQGQHYSVLPARRVGHCSDAYWLGFAPATGASICSHGATTRKQPSCRATTGSCSRRASIRMSRMQSNQRLCTSYSDHFVPGWIVSVPGCAKGGVV